MALDPSASAGDESSLNMTPMIDIVFNLVIFFMLSVDLSRKDYAALTLPTARNGTPDRPVAAPGPDDRRVVVSLTADGSLVFRGRSWPLSSSDPRQQDLALEGLRRELIVATRPPELRDEKGASRVSVLVRGDRTAKWRYAQWILAVCAESPIRIYKVQFAVDAPPR